MAEQDKKELDVKNLDVAELTDDDLEDASGGGGYSLPDTTNTCPIENYNC
jgi:hypothetical protein